MSIEDVERIMDETREGIEYQRVGAVYIMWKNVLFSSLSSLNFTTVTVSYSIGIYNAFIFSFLRKLTTF